MTRLQLFVRLLLLIACLTLPVFSRAAAQPTALSAPVTKAGADYRNGLEQETFSLVNQYRQANQLPPLLWDNTIAKVARGHSSDMAAGDVDFGHDGFTQRVTRLRTALPGLRGAGENVLETDNPDQVARTAVAIWLKSPHHLKNIRGDFNCSGMGIWVAGNGTIYFTQIFVKTAPPVQETQAAPEPQLVTPFGLLATPKTR